MKKIFNKKQLFNLLERAGWTFLEGALVALPIFGLEGIDKATIVAALMSGVSALKTFIIDIIRAKLSEKELEQLEDHDYIE